ncbi:hypothetical protein LTS18_007597 [Coniosporium uncinatum]|uniref:Uncharacterized protein n=1 Tax=Coniosporium uncinatum TaxID=93489 RepID=A0ACC3DAG4_9PEZI|nr:hypothetical protein LTS18_007597 [Coniosporium uncinatum]
MFFQTLSVAALFVASSSAAPASHLVDRQVPTASYPTTEAWDWAAGGSSNFTIHPSCNITQRRQLENALAETIELASHARDHILRWGNSSTFYTKYFGQGPTAEPMGWYSKVASADKTGAIFRCDDPDMNCATQDAWAGHWRGSNATQETVICPLSFEIRRHLDSMCGLGYTVAGSPTNYFWASDLLHRVYHVPKISEGIVEHYSEDYQGVLTLAQEQPELSARDSDALQYFALDVYAFDISVPGIGCTGQAPPPEEAEAGTSSSISAAASATQSATSASSAVESATSEASSAAAETTLITLEAPMTSATPTAAEAVETGTATTSAADTCHTHDDGFVHC